MIIKPVVKSLQITLLNLLEEVSAAVLRLPPIRNVEPTAYQENLLEKLATMSKIMENMLPNITEEVFDHVFPPNEWPTTDLNMKQ